MYKSNAISDFCKWTKRFTSAEGDQKNMKYIAIGKQNDHRNSVFIWPLRIVSSIGGRCGCQLNWHWIFEKPAQHKNEFATNTDDFLAQFPLL